MCVRAHVSRMFLDIPETHFRLFAIVLLALEGRKEAFHFLPYYINCTTGQPSRKLDWHFERVAKRPRDPLVGNYLGIMPCDFFLGRTSLLIQRHLFHTYIYLLPPTVNLSTWLTHSVDKSPCFINI